MVNWTVIIVALISLAGSIIAARYSGHKALDARYHANRAADAHAWIARSAAEQAALGASMARHPSGHARPPVPAHTPDWAADDPAWDEPVADPPPDSYTQ